MKLLPGIAGLLISGTGAYFLFLFIAFHHWYSTPPRELLIDIYLVEAIFTLVVGLLLGISIHKLVRGSRP